MIQAYVVNHGTQPYKEKWDNQEITFAPGEKKVMERTEAIRFLGTFAAENKDANGDTLNGKTLHLEDKDDPWAARDSGAFISQIDGEDYGTDAALKAHYAEFKHMRLVRDVSDDVAEKMKIAQTTGKANRVFACHICDFETSDKRGLSGHMRSHDAKSTPHEG